MTRIIKNGKTNFTARCERCLCDFEYELSDLSKKHGYVEYIRCPCCGLDIRHNPITNEQPSNHRTNDLFDLSEAVHFQEEPNEKTND